MSTIQVAASGGPSETVRVRALQVLLAVGTLAAWEIVARSGILFRDVVPSLLDIVVELYATLLNPSFYWGLGVTVGEIVPGVLLGGGAGVVVGLVLGRSKLLSAAFEPYLFYFGPTPKIIFFPVLIMLFGIGAGSKIAMGALSCFFPIAITTASAVREINPVLVKVGLSNRLSRWHMATKIYLPAIRPDILNGLRLGLGIAIIGTVLAETKLSNQGIGYMIIQSYTTFNMPRMYSILIIIFILASLVNVILGRLAAK